MLLDTSPDSEPVRAVNLDEIGKLQALAAGRRRWDLLPECACPCDRFRIIYGEFICQECVNNAAEAAHERHMAAFQYGGAIGSEVTSATGQGLELDMRTSGITFPVVSNAMLRAIALLGKSSLAKPLPRVWYPRPSRAWVVGCTSGQW